MKEQTKPDEIYYDQIWFWSHFSFKRWTRSCIIGFMYPYTRSRKNKKKARYKTKSHSHFSNPKVCMPRKRAVHTGVRFISFLSGGFTTIAVINPTEKKFAKRISVCSGQKIIWKFIKFLAQLCFYLKCYFWPPCLSDYLSVKQWKQYIYFPLFSIPLFW